MTIIEVDGGNVEPLLVDQIQIFAAQRYSVVVTADQPINNYWIRSIPNHQGASIEGGLNAAILRYRGAPEQDPTTSDTGGILPLIETNLHPFEKSVVPGKPFPGGADININLNVVLNSDFLFEINNSTYEPPTVPVLLQILSGAKTPQELLPSGSIYSLQRDKSVEITIPGGVIAGPHPLHLHGHSFYVVRSAGNSSYNWDNPVLRDTVSIGIDTTDNVTIRFTTDNPGPWFIHCHIDWHLNVGFAAVMAEDISDVPSVDPTSAAWKNLCPTYNAFNN